MTFAEFEEMFAAVLPELPQMISDATTGEGGLQKIVKVGGDVMTAAQMINTAVAAHPSVVSAPAAPAT